MVGQKANPFLGWVPAFLTSTAATPFAWGAVTQSGPPLSAWELLELVGVCRSCPVTGGPPSSCRGDRIQPAASSSRRHRGCPPFRHVAKFEPMFSFGFITHALTLTIIGR